MGKGLQIRKLKRRHYKGLCEFFEALNTSKSNLTFHPHPFDNDTAEALCEAWEYDEDLYYVMDYGDQILGYAMLRGWDEGYINAPSLGIAIHPEYRGKGLSKLFMDFLHKSAEAKGAERVILKVYKDNIPAVKLYKKIGYKFTDLNDKEYRGILEL